MDQPTKPSRKKFLWWGAAAAASIAGFRFFGRQKPKSKIPGDTVKMLTQDGRLVEIDKALLASNKKKITDDELKKWVNKKSDQQ